MKLHWVLLSLFSFNCAAALEAIQTTGTMRVDGVAKEVDWQAARWYPMDKLMVGDMPTQQDFHGRFKVMWDERQLYLLAEITDDILFDQYANPLERYWDDDCLEIFIDENNSGGNHQFNFNAFAYHVALDNQVVDIGPNKPNGETNFILLNDHVTSRWQRQKEAPYVVTWELSIRAYPDSFALEKAKLIQPVQLSMDKRMGFMLAYCDNDGSPTRESFMGSTKIEPRNGSKNLGYITSDVFDTLILK